jgi:ARG and Rhodanese-Phosphatase-superfamily-associated Protein domain
MIEEAIQIGDPVEHRGIVIAPVYPRKDPKAEYLTLEEALPLGFRITEIDEAGSVPELNAVNPLDRAVLLYDGEELLGAKQNRILNVTVLVAARTETRIPVSCVEQGRWHTRSASFDAAQHTAYPDLRRRKAERLSAEPLARGAAQSAVWEEVAAKAGRHGVQSPTGAQRDIFAASENALAGLRKAFPLAAGQAGALFALGDRLCLDYVSRPETFVCLYPKLLDGYLLDAVEHLDGTSASQEQLAGFIAAADSAPSTRQPSAGLGDDLRLARSGLVGSGLVLGDELVQLCVFSADEERPRTGVARPSRRRSA